MFNNGDIVYIGTEEFDIRAIDNDRVVIADTSFPLFTKELSREEFAEKINLSPNYIYEIEKGNSIPGCKALIDICNTFEIAPSNLLDKYLEKNVYTASELVNSSFHKLSKYDKKLIIDIINLLADR